MFDTVAACRSRWAVLVLAGAAVALPCSAQADPITYETLICGKEHSAAFASLAEIVPQEIAPGVLFDPLAWDVDISPVGDGTFRLVWEGGGANYRLFDPDAPDTVDRCLAAGPMFGEDATGFPVGGNSLNPEVFGDKMVFHGHVFKCIDGSNDGNICFENLKCPMGRCAPALVDIKWLDVDDLDSTLGGGTECQPEETDPCNCERNQRVKRLSEDVNRPSALDVYDNRKAAVTDGNIAAWWECKGDCKKFTNDIDVWGFKFPFPTTAKESSRFFPIATSTALERRPRVAEIGPGRSLVVYEACTSPPDCVDQAEIRASVVDFELAEPVVGAYFTIDSTSAGEPPHWPDVQGDIVVWDRTVDSASGNREIYGCQLQNLAGATSCGVPFRITVDPEEQFRPTVFDDLVAWGERHAELLDAPESVHCEIVARPERKRSHRHDGGRAAGAGGGGTG